MLRIAQPVGEALVPRYGDHDARTMKIAIIGPSFFGYLERLAVTLCFSGATAEFLDERPSNRVLAKLALRLAPRRIARLACRRHHVALTERILTTGITHVLLVSPEIFPRDLVERLRAAGLTVCRYAWDSVSNRTHATALDDGLDRVASFDPDDCRARGYTHIPLYSPAAPAAMPDSQAREIAFLYCGTLHSNRPARLARLGSVCRRNGWPFARMLFYHSRLLWLLRYASHPVRWPFVARLATTPFPYETLYEEVRNARVVIDIHHPAQTGLTMRTYEALALGAVVLTTNAHAPQGLPPELAARVVVMAPGDPEPAMRQALAIEPAPLPEPMQQFLSAGRFAGQLLDFLAPADQRSSNVR